LISLLYSTPTLSFHREGKERKKITLTLLLFLREREEKKEEILPLARSFFDDKKDLAFYNKVLI